MGFTRHRQTLAGLPVQLYDPKRKGKKPRRPCVYRLTCPQDYSEEGEFEGMAFSDLLDRFLEDHGGAKLKALVIGSWEASGDEDLFESAEPVIEPTVAAASRMKNLKALFLGDIIQEECEVSWIRYGDISPLFGAFPKLEEFYLRGTSNVSLGKLKHAKLKKLVLQGGGMPAALLAEVFKAKLPKLEHLELWLGDPDYGGISDAEPLKPLLGGKLFPKLKYLGLRNSAVADEVARAVADSAVVDRLHTLDLSLGNLSDRGAEAILGSPRIRKLKKLDVQHHFISVPLRKALETELGIEVDLSDARVPDFFTDDDRTEVYRYIVASE